MPVILLILLSLGSSPVDAATVLATSSTGPVTIEHISAYFRYPSLFAADPEQPARGTEAWLESGIRGVVLTRLLAQKARDSGTDTGLLYRARLEETWERYLSSRYQREVALAEIHVSTEEVRTQYESNPEAWRVDNGREIDYLFIKPTNVSHDPGHLLELRLDLQQRLYEGESFEAIVQEVVDEAGPTSKVETGRNWVERDRFDPAFTALIFELAIGEVRCFAHEGGIAVIRCLHIREAAVQPLEAVSEAIRAGLVRQRQRELLNQRFVEGCTRFNASVADTIPDPEKAKVVILTFGGRELRVGEFLKRLEDTLARPNNSELDRSGLRIFAQAWLEREVFAAWAKLAGLERGERAREERGFIERSCLARTYLDRLTERVEPSEEDLESTKAAHPGLTLSEPAWGVTELTLPATGPIELVCERLREGVEAEAMRAYGVVVEATMTPEWSASVIDVLRNMQPGQVSDPIRRGPIALIYRLDSVEHPKPLTVEEAEPELLSWSRKRVRRRFRNALYQDLLRTAKIQIDRATIGEYLFVDGGVLR